MTADYVSVRHMICCFLCYFTEKQVFFLVNIFREKLLHFLKESFNIGLLSFVSEQNLYNL